MTTELWLTIISNSFAILLSIIAISISLYFYNKTNKTEKEVSKSLTDISGQSKLLENISFNLIEKLIDKSFKGSDTHTQYLFNIIQNLLLPQKLTTNYDELIEKTAKAISKSSSPENIKSEVTKTYLEYIFSQHNYNSLRTIYDSFDKTFEIKIDRNKGIVRTFLNNEFRSESGLQYFLEQFFDLHSKNIIKILSLEPFEFTISDNLKEQIKEIYNEIYNK